MSWSPVTISRVSGCSATYCARDLHGFLERAHRPQHAGRRCWRGSSRRPPPPRRRGRSRRGRGRGRRAPRGHVGERDGRVVLVAQAFRPRLEHLLAGEQAEQPVAVGGGQLVGVGDDRVALVPAARATRSGDQQSSPPPRTTSGWVSSTYCRAISSCWSRSGTVLKKAAGEASVTCDVVTRPGGPAGCGGLGAEDGQRGAVEVDADPAVVGASPGGPGGGGGRGVGDDVVGVGRGGRLQADDGIDP